MQILHGFDIPAAYRGGCVSIGNFDGVHRGHRRIVETLLRRAQEANRPAVVFTFDPHPITILRPEHAPPPLTTSARKVELLGEFGIDCALLYPTDRALLDLTPDEFFTRIVQGELQATGLVEGPNFFYGHKRAGNVETLRRSCEGAGLSFDAVEPIRLEGQLVSSSEIRGLIAKGDVYTAAELLGRDYDVEGVVTQGAGRGRTIGIPTANLTAVKTLLPADGVYAGAAFVAGRRVAAALNLGPNPTFAEQARKLEVHLLDFSGDLYGRTLRVEFWERLRETVRFEGVEQLKAQIAVDIRRVCALAEARLSG
jgi:riboflavin kinase/FMN adenylyltransferase